MSALLCTWVAVAFFQSAAHSASVHGTVRDSHGAAVADATVRLGLKTNADAASKTVHSDANGTYRLMSLQSGNYTVRADKQGLGKAAFGPFLLEDNQSKTVDLVLKAEPDLVDFVDEPKFTVAGVTDHTYMGGHGSDVIQRSAEELTKATGALGKDAGLTLQPSNATEESLRNVLARDPSNVQANDQLGRLLAAAGRYPEALAYLEKALQREPSNADLHRLLANADESVNKPLDAVHEYQRAAELDASETNLFDWGTELLVHQALQPALELFERGARLYPESSRMLLGAGTAAYAQRDYSSATSYFLKACDIHPQEAQPYLFLGKLHRSDTSQAAGFIDRMARFASLQPQNAWANYYYAVSLWTQRKGLDDATAALSLLEKAVQLDPQMAIAFLQLGIIDADKNDLPAAIRSYQRAIEIDPTLEQAHYRLAQAYRQSYEAEKARAEDAVFQKLSKTSAEELARERAELQRFVITLK